MSTSLPFSRRVIQRIGALAGLMLLLVVAGSAGLLQYTVQEIDEAQVAEERALIQRRLDRGLEQMVSDVTSSSIWDDAYRLLGEPLDLAWADENVGGYYDKYLGHTASVVMDAGNQPVYFWQNGRLPAAESWELIADAASLIRAVREREQRKAPAGRLVGFRAVTTGRGIMESRGNLYLVAASTVVPETRDEAWRTGPSPLILSVRRIDGRYLAGLSRDLRISDPHVHRVGSHGENTLPLIGLDGAQIGEMSWTPKTPGEGRIREIYPQLLAGILVLLAASLAMALHIRAVHRQLEQDDAELDKAMRDLVSARDEASNASRAKSQFLANMSHEIRTPLNGVLGMAQVMERDELTPRQHERLRIIAESGRALLTLLNDILDVSKIEAGRLELEDTEFDLEELVKAASATFREMAEHKGLALQVQVSPGAQGRWRGDPMRLRQVIANLVSNAVKFTAQGRIDVEAERTGEGLVIRVRDTGVGIPPDRIGTLFEKFTQVDASTTRQYGGTGLGLAISRELVELMKGRIGVESRLGVGSTFTVTAPLSYVAAPEAASAERPEEAGEGELRILAVEDNVTNRVILEALLAPLRGSLTMVPDGREAVEAVRRGGYELVLMDIQMPHMNGIEATRAIRAWEAANNRRPIPIIAVTANALPEQVQEYREAGMTGFIAKPIESGRLIAAMTEAVERSGRA